MKITFTRSFIVLLVLSAVGFTSCSKSSTKTKAELLTESPWKQVSKGYDDNNNGLIDDRENYLYSCDLDNIWTFRKDNTLTEDEGAVRCSSSVGYSYDWHLSSDDKALTIEGHTYTIEKLDSYTLEVSDVYAGSNGPETYLRKWTR